MLTMRRHWGVNPPVFILHKFLWAQLARCLSSRRSWIVPLYLKYFAFQNNAGSQITEIFPPDCWVCARLCCHWHPSLQHLAIFRYTPSVFLKSLTLVFSPLCLCNCSAAAVCDLCTVTLRVCSIDCVLIHYSAPPARRSQRAAAPAVTGQPGIYESVIILSFLSVCLPPCSVFVLLLVFLLLHLPLSLSTCHISLSRPPPPIGPGCSHLHIRAEYLVPVFVRMNT